MCHVDHEAIKQSAAWQRLELVGIQRFEAEQFELRNCAACGSTLCKDITMTITDLGTLKIVLAAMRRSREVRHMCGDCNDVTDEGLPGGPCARHGQRCIGCGGHEIEAPDAQVYEDGVPGFWCRGCLHGEDAST